MLALGTELEGHPDNIGAALEGGFVICDGPWIRVHRFEPPMGLEAVLVVPHEAVRTEAARAALPASVPLRRRRVQRRAGLDADARPGERQTGI